MDIKEMAKILPGTVIIFAVLWLTAHSSPLESNFHFDDSANNASDSTSTAEVSNRLSLPRGGRRTAWSKEENGDLKSDDVKNEQFAGQKNSSRAEKWRLKKLVDYIISILTKDGDANNSLNNLRDKEESMNATQTKNSKNKSDVSSPTFNDNNPKTNSIALANNNSNNLKNDRVSNGASSGDTDFDNSVNNHKGEGKNEGNDGNDISTVENTSSGQNQKSQNVEINDKKTSSSMNASGKYRNYDNEGNDDGRANEPDKEAQPPDDNNSNPKHSKKDQKEFLNTSDVPQNSENDFIITRSQTSQNDLFTTKSEHSNISEGNFQNAQPKSLQNAQNSLSNSRSPSLQNDENKYISKESQLLSDNSKESTKIVEKMSQKSNSQKLQNSTRSNLSQEQQKETESYPSSDFSAYEGIDSTSESVSSEESITSSECDDFDSDPDNTRSNEYLDDSSYENCSKEAEKNTTTQRPESFIEADEKILQKTPREIKNANVKSVAPDKLFNRSENKPLSFTTSIKNSASLQQAHMLQNSDKTRQSIKNAPNQTPSKQGEIISDSKDSKEISAGVANRKEKTQSLYKNKTLQNGENTTKSTKISENKSKEPFQQKQMHEDRNSEDTLVDVEKEKENTQSPQQNKELQNTPEATDTAENKDEEPSQDDQILADNKQTEENKLYSVNENENTQTLQQSQIINNNTESFETFRSNGKASFHEEQILADRNSEGTPVDAEKEKENAQSLQQNKLLLNIKNTPGGNDNAENKDKERSQGEQILTDNKQTEEYLLDSVNENTQSLRQDEILRNRKNSVEFLKFSENECKDTFQQHEALTSREHLDDTSNVVANKKENTQSLQQNEINQKIDNTVETIYTVENKGIESSQQEQTLTDRNSINTSVDAENDKEEIRYPQQDETFVNKIYSTSPDSFPLKVNNEQSLEPENTKITYHVYDSPIATDDMKYLASMQTSSGTIDNTKSSTNYIKEKEVSNTQKQNESITNNIYPLDSPSNYKNKIETETVVDSNFKKVFLRPSYSRQLPNFSVNNENAKSLTSEETYDTMVKSRANNINAFNSPSGYKNQIESGTVLDVDSKRTFLNPTYSHQESPNIAVNSENTKPSKKTYDTILEYMYEHSNSPLFKTMRRENSRNQRNDFAYQ